MRKGKAGKPAPRVPSLRRGIGQGGAPLERNADRRALAEHAVNRQVTPMGFHDAPADGEPEAQEPPRARLRAASAR